VPSVPSLPPFAVGGLFAAVAVGPLLTPSDAIFNPQRAKVLSSLGAGLDGVWAYAFFWAMSFGFHGASVLLCTLVSWCNYCTVL
jgi:hypothetical protein